MDAAVKLVGVSANQTIRYVYVRSGEAWTLEGLPEGTYWLRYTQGREWDMAALRFRRNAVYREFERPLTFDEARADRGVQYATYEVTLHAVVSGNAPTRAVREVAF
jgi:hypothetical protein